MWKDNKMANFWLGFIWSNNREREEIIYFNLIQLKIGNYSIFLEILLSYYEILFFYFGILLFYLEILLFLEILTLSYVRIPIPNT